jgi:hypothetical protein
MAKNNIYKAIENFIHQQEANIEYYKKTDNNSNEFNQVKISTINEVLEGLKAHLYSECNIEYDNYAKALYKQVGKHEQKWYTKAE